jgi:hypothetical protein
MILVLAVVARNIKNVVGSRRGDILQDIYLDKEKLNEISDTVKELGVSL